MMDILRIVWRPALLAMVAAALVVQANDAREAALDRDIQAHRLRVAEERLADAEAELEAVDAEIGAVMRELALHREIMRAARAKSGGSQP